MSCLVTLQRQLGEQLAVCFQREETMQAFGSAVATLFDADIDDVAKSAGQRGVLQRHVLGAGARRDCSGLLRGLLGLAGI